MQHNIFGISTNGDQRFADKFNTVFDESESYFESQVFHHDVDDDIKFDYTYCVHVFDWREYDSKKCAIGIQLYLVPTFQSLTKEKQDSVLSCCCIDADDVTVMDMVSYGIGVPLGYVEVEVDENFEYDTDDDKIASVLDSIANVYETIDAMRGFYLDKPVNRLGSDGWDLLYDYVNGNDFIQSTLDRYKD